MSTELANRPANELRAFLASRKSELAAVASKYMTPERTIQVAILCTYKTPDLLKCDPETILASVIQAASLGLDLSPSAGEAYLVPYFNREADKYECQFQAGWQGLTKLVRNTGKVNFVKAEVVRQGDKFRYWQSDGTYHYEHEPSGSEKLGNVTHAYAVAMMATGEAVVEAMTLAELEYIRSRSKMANGPAWKSFPGEMYKKTVIRRLCKSLPKSAELADALESVDREYEQVDATGEPTETDRPARVSNGTPHGSGKYASPKETAQYLLKMEAYLAQREAAWLDRWTGMQGEIPSDMPPYPNRWQADNHLVKWAMGLGLIDPASTHESGPKINQLGRLTAIVYHADTDGQRKVAKELEAYLTEQERILADRIYAKHPELDPDNCDSEDEPEPTPQAPTPNPAAASKTERKPATDGGALIANRVDLFNAFRVTQSTAHPDREDLKKPMHANHVKNGVANAAIGEAKIGELDTNGKRDAAKVAAFLAEVWAGDRDAFAELVDEYLDEKLAKLGFPANPFSRPDSEVTDDEVMEGAAT